jgi:hypothetical protein
LGFVGFYLLRAFLERMSAIPSVFASLDVPEVRDVAMPHGIDTIHLKQGFQDPQFLICHKGHGNA